MSQNALNLDNWELVKYENEFRFSYNNRVMYSGLKIDAIKFYYYLKERFGPPNVTYSEVAVFFSEKNVSTGTDWCYLFKTEYHFILISGDDHIGISVLSIYEPPEKIDLEIFCNKINKTLEKFELTDYEVSRFDIFVNYGFFLSNLIDKYRLQAAKKIPELPEVISIPLDDADKDTPEEKYKIFQYAKDYNHWLKAIIEMATVSLQIQILFPVYFESLVDLAFRIKLKGKYYDPTINYGDDRRPKNIFQHFEVSNLSEKLTEIREKCFQVDQSKLKTFIKEGEYLHMRKERNKLLHGNSLFFKNLNLKYYHEGQHLVGFPDKHKAERVISESISEALIKDDLQKFIIHYQNLCDQFLDIFDDNGYIRKLAQGIAFGHNARIGGAFSLPFTNLEDLYLPER